MDEKFRCDLCGLDAPLWSRVSTGDDICGDEQICFLCVPLTEHEIDMIRELNSVQQRPCSICNDNPCCCGEPVSVYDY